MKNKTQLIILGIVLVLGFVVRLYKIDNPIADWHSWRQADTSAVTRNFFKHGIDLLHPRYDDFSDVSSHGLINTEGYRFVEFPIFNVLHYLLAATLRFNSLEYWGRMVSVFASLTSATALFFLVRRRSDFPTGALTAFFFLFLPYNIYFSRVVLPDPLMVALFLLSLNFSDIWFKKPQIWSFVLTATFGAMAVLVKPVALFFLLPITWQFWQKYKFKSLAKLEFWILHALFVAPFGLWRLWSHKYPAGIPSSFWLLNGNKIRFKGAFFQWIFGERLGAIILGKWGVFPLAQGITALGSYFAIWILAALLYLFTLATGNVQHDYYQIPLIPAISVLLALGTYQLWKTKKLLSRVVTIVSLIFMFAFSWYTVRGNYQVNHWEIVHAGARVDKITPKDAIVVAPWGGDTAFLYQTNRQGFPYVIMPIKDLKDRFGASYYVSVNFDDQTNAIMSKYTIVEKTSEYVIVKLDEPIRP